MSRMKITIAYLVFAIAFALPGFALGDTDTNQPRDDEGPEVVDAASHVGLYEKGRMTWKSTYELKGFVKNEVGRVELLNPLPKDAEVTEVSPDGVEPRRDGRGRIVGLDLPTSPSAPWRVDLVVRQPYEPPQDLAPPAAGRHATQRVALQGVRFAPTDESALVEHPGFVAPRNFDFDTKAKFDNQFGDPPREANASIFYRPVDLDGATISGAITSEKKHRTRSLTVLLGVLGLLVASGALGFRWLDSKAKEEEAEAILREHGGDLGL